MAGSSSTASEPSPYGCSPSLLRYALEAAARRNVQIRSVADALRAAKMSEVSRQAA
jgi:hypothetical protein